jgi:hypothetical protein
MGKGKREDGRGKMEERSSKEKIEGRGKEIQDGRGKMEDGRKNDGRGMKRQSIEKNRRNDCRIEAIMLCFLVFLLLVVASIFIVTPKA